MAITEDSTIQVENLVKSFLEIIGEDVNREGLKKTPQRVQKMVEEIFSGYRQTPEDILSTAFTNENYNEMVVVKDIEFYSICEHHLLPFFGHVHIGYIPGAKMVGLSKLVRLVDCFSKRLQIQERMTVQIADAIDSILKPYGVGVIVEAEHLCMAVRGVKKHTKAVTSALRGGFLHDDVKKEFLSFVQ
jgi:GTP cyclohydrolase I